MTTSPKRPTMRPARSPCPDPCARSIGALWNPSKEAGVIKIRHDVPLVVTSHYTEPGGVPHAPDGCFSEGVGEYLSFFVFRVRVLGLLVGR